MAPPLPMMSRIFSGLILMVMMRGAKALTSPRAEGMTSVMLVEDEEARRVGLGETGADDVLVDALHLDVHLEGRDALRGAGDLEVHVTEEVLLAEDVGEDGEAAHRR